MMAPKTTWYVLEDIDGLFREYKNIVLTETERRG